LKKFQNRVVRVLFVCKRGEIGVIYQGGRDGWVMQHMRKKEMFGKNSLVKSWKGILPSLSMEANCNELRNVSWLERRLRLVISACRCQNIQRMCSGIVDGSFINFCFSY
jgi:hypothetical protein